MIVTELYDGQGLGNQLWCYFVTKIIAKHNGYDYGIIGKNKFKGKEFIKIDFGNQVINGSGPEGGPPTKLPDTILNYYKEKQIIHPSSRLDISDFDEQLWNVHDNTKIDGVMQSYSYIKSYKEYILNSINISSHDRYKKIENNNICIIHVRGGDFNNSLASLTQKYYNDAMNIFKQNNSNIKFYAVTDDVNTCRNLLPNIPIIGSSELNQQDNHKANHHMGGPIEVDFNILNNCINVIISASSFSWWAVWLNKKNINVIAPKYWAAFKQSDGYWSTSDIVVPEWKYLDKNGIIYKK